MITFAELAQKVKRGARLLDKRIPNWRTIMRKHADQFDFSDGDCCVLGTLEHHSGLLRKIQTPAARAAAIEGRMRYTVAAKRLGIDKKAYGFENEGGVTDLFDNGGNLRESSKVLHTLWKAEFSA